MSLMRHATPHLTVNTYARTRLERLHGLVENVGETLNPNEKCVTRVSLAACGAKGQTGNASRNKGLEKKEEWWRRRESNPCSP